MGAGKAAFWTGFKSQRVVFFDCDQLSGHVNVDNTQPRVK